MKNAVFGAVALGLVAAAPEAAAQTGGWRLSVERVAGFAYSSLTSSSTTTAGGVTVTTSRSTAWSSLNLLGSIPYGAGGVGALPGGLPTRLALDYELASHLTVGLAAFLVWNSFNVEGDEDGLATFGFGIAPRVGYSIRLGDRLHFWPRAGVTFSRVGSSPDDRVSGGTTTSTTIAYTAFWVNLEPTLVYEPVDHFGLTLAVVGDIPLTGDSTTTRVVTSGGNRVETTISSDQRLLTVGLQFGVQGRF